MPPKYYCDYCDKQFHDTPASRKRHTQGSMHQRAKKLWFDSFKDPDFSKPRICSYFMRTGLCQYGQNCKFLHPIPPGSIVGGNAFESSNAFGQPMNLTATLPGAMVYDSLGVQPVASVKESTLPPSLQPPPEGGYPYIPVVDWG